MLKHKIVSILQYVVLTSFALLFLVPLSALILRAFSVPLKGFSIYFFTQVLAKPRNRLAFATGLKISSLAAFITIVTSLMAASALTRKKGGLQDSFLTVILMLSGIPYCTLVIPLYFILFVLHLLDSVYITVLFLAAANVPATVRIFCIYLESLPSEASENARLDGTGTTTVFLRIILPQLMPVLTGAFITTFINSWGNFIIPFMLLSSSDKLPIALAFFQSFSAGDPSLYGYLSAYAILYYIPVIVLYLVLRLGVTRLFVVHRLKA